MWLLSGPFDDCESPQTKLKLLKPGKKYYFGRNKGMPPPNETEDAGAIHNGSKFTSKVEGLFIVKTLDEKNLSVDSALTYTRLNEKKQAALYRYDSKKDKTSEYTLPAGGEGVVLQTGDVIKISATLSLEVCHEPIFVHATPQIPKAVAVALSAKSLKLGIHTTRTWTQLTTHFLVQSIPPLPDPSSKNHPKPISELYPRPWLCGLIQGARFVTRPWLEALLTQGELPSGTGGLEDVWDNVDEERYFPEGSNDLWKPDERRQGMFSKFKFLVLFDGDKAPDNFINILSLGGGDAVSYSVSADNAAKTSVEWAAVVKNHRSKQHVDEGQAMIVVIIALDLEVLQGQDESTWRDVYEAGTEESGMRILTEDDVALSILHVDTSYIRSSLDHELSQQRSFATKASSTFKSRKETQTTPASSPAQPSTSHGPTQKFILSTLADEVSDHEQDVANLTTSRVIRKKSLALKKPASVVGGNDTTAEITIGKVIPRKRAGPTVSEQDAPAPIEEDAIVQRPVKRKRKVGAFELLGLDDTANISNVADPANPSAAEPSETVQSGPPSLPPSSPPLTSASTRRPLKRRTRAERERFQSLALGLDEAEDVLASSSQAKATPAHKEFQYLFDGTQPEGAVSVLDGLMNSSDGDEQTDLSVSQSNPSGRTGTQSRSLRSQPQSRAQSPAQSIEQTQSQMQTKLAGSKRKASNMTAIMEDDEMEGGTQATVTTSTSSKRRAVDGVNSITWSSTQPQGVTVSVKPVSAVKSMTDAPKGAAATGVTKAPQILQAIASLKKGKRKDDEFDREFNNLRISVPRNGTAMNEQRERERKDEDALWDGMEKDMNIVGNFMVVVETDEILRKDGGRKAPAVLDDGRPNFKKFKKKVPVRRTAVVELYRDEPADFGQGSTYWEQDSSGEIELEHRPAAQKRVATISRSTANKGLPVTEPSNDDSDGMLPPRVISKARPKAKVKPVYEPTPTDLAFSDREPVAPTRRSNASGRRATRAVLDDDNDEEDFGRAMAAIGPDVSDSESFEATGTLKSSTGPSVTRQTRASSRARSQTPSQATTSRSTRKTPKKKRLAPVDSDDDDGLDFQGSGARKKSRR